MIALCRIVRPLRASRRHRAVDRAEFLLAAADAIGQRRHASCPLNDLDYPERCD